MSDNGVLTDKWDKSPRTMPTGMGPSWDLCRNLSSQWNNSRSTHSPYRRKNCDYVLKYTSYLDDPLGRLVRKLLFGPNLGQDQLKLVFRRRGAPLIQKPVHIPAHGAGLGSRFRLTRPKATTHVRISSMLSIAVRLFVPGALLCFLVQIHRITPASRNGIRLLAYFEYRSTNS